MNLNKLGFTDFFENQYQQMQIKNGNWLIGRVTLEHKHSYRVMTKVGELLATVSGSYAYHSTGNGAFFNDHIFLHYKNSPSMISTMGCFKKNFS